MVNLLYAEEGYYDFPVKLFCLTVAGTVSQKQSFGVCRHLAVVGINCTCMLQMNKPIKVFGKNEEKICFDFDQKNNRFKRKKTTYPKHSAFQFIKF